MSTYTYPHTIENGAGEQITFVRRVQDPAGDRLEVENLVKPDSGPPPRNVHTYQEEALTIQQGQFGYKRPGEPPRFAEPGETVVFEPGEAHRFWNTGEEGASAAVQGSSVGSCAFHVGFDTTGNVCGLLVANVFDTLGRNSDDQTTRREFLILRHQSAGGHD
jgi:quercetin dioxygenase-like cupin family protein